MSFISTVKEAYQDANSNFLISQFFPYTELYRYSNFRILLQLGLIIILSYKSPIIEYTLSNTLVPQSQGIVNLVIFDVAIIKVIVIKVFFLL